MRGILGKRRLGRRGIGKQYWLAIPADENLRDRRGTRIGNQADGCARCMSSGVYLRSARSSANLYYLRQEDQVAWRFARCAQLIRREAETLVHRRRV